MRLLVPTRMGLALRWATIPSVSRAVSTRPPKKSQNVLLSLIYKELREINVSIRKLVELKEAVDKNAPVSPVVGLQPPAVGAAMRLLKTYSKSAAAPSTDEFLQQLWKLSKLSPGELNPTMKREVEDVASGKVNEKGLATIVKKLSDHNEFPLLEKLLEGYDRCMKDAKKVPIEWFNEVLWAAARAKSLGALSTSITDWIEREFRRLPFSRKGNSIMWLMSIVRDDLHMLDQLRQSNSNGEVVRPPMYRDQILRYAALVYLEAGKDEEFRSLWTASRTPVLRGEKPYVIQPTAILHHALLRRGIKAKPDDAMLRWYLDTLPEDLRTSIPQNPQFEIMMVPVIRSLGGKIEKWKEDDRRKEKLRKWRDDYDDSELDNLVESLIDYMRYRVEVENVVCLEDLNRLEKMLVRLREKDIRGRETVVVDWLNLRVGTGHAICINNLFPSCSLVVVGREKGKTEGTPLSPEENKRTYVMEVTGETERNQEMDDWCSIILAVATRGHLFSNDKSESHLQGFEEYLENESKDVRLVELLRKYLNDAWLRHGYTTKLIQPAVDHSRAAQWIDKEKKELAFTVARKSKEVRPDRSFRIIDYYSVRID